MLCICLVLGRVLVGFNEFGCLGDIFTSLGAIYLEYVGCLVIGELYSNNVYLLVVAGRSRGYWQ